VESTAVVNWSEGRVGTLAAALLLLATAPAKPQTAMLAAPAHRSDGGGGLPAASNATLPMTFVRNDGQWDPSVRFMIMNGRGRGWLTDTGFVAQLVEFHRTGPVDRHRELLAEDEGWWEGVNVAFSFEGGSASPNIEARDELPGRYHYFIDNDPARWHRNVPAFGRVIYHDVYPGIDVEYYEKDGCLEYDLVLQPGADGAAIRLRYEGADGVSSESDGAIQIHTALGDVLHTAPYLAEADESPPVCSRLVLTSNGRIAFCLEGWDGKRPLRIDPALIYGSYIGGAGQVLFLDSVVDAQGRLMTAGHAQTGFPTTPGAFQEAYAGHLGDAVISCFDAAGSSLSYSTYVGTSDTSDGAAGLGLSATGEALVFGYTHSAQFPVTTDAFDATLNGGEDLVLLRLSADGSDLLYSSYYGGSADDKLAVGGLAVGPTGDIYLAGSTDSLDFPTTPGVLGPTLTAPRDTYIMRLTNGGSSLVVSTYGGAVGPSWLQVETQALAVDANGAAYVAGRVSGPGLPVTAGAFDPTHNGELDGYVMKVTGSGDIVRYCTYFGGVHWEDTRGIAVDASGAVTIMGLTDSIDLPDTPGAYSGTKLGSDCPYVARLNPNGSALQYCTYVGGDCFNDPYAFALDDQGYAYVGGLTCQSFPTTPDALKQGPSGLYTDGFLLQLDPTGGSVSYATLVGGDSPASFGGGTETVRTMALDGHGGVYLVGETSSLDFPVTPGAYDTLIDNASDCFVLKLDFGPWANVGHALAGTGGKEPFLSGNGPLVPTSAGGLVLYDAKPSSPAYLVVGLDELAAPFKGGTLVPTPQFLLPLSTDAAGGLSLSWSHWPAGLPAGAQLLLQYWIVDPAGPAGFSASNGLLGVTPGP
jgi:hypothetical protein